MDVVIVARSGIDTFADLRQGAVFGTNPCTNDSGTVILVGQFDHQVPFFASGDSAMGLGGGDLEVSDHERSKVCFFAVALVLIGMVASSALAVIMIAVIMIIAGFFFSTRNEGCGNGDDRQE